MGHMSVINAPDMYIDPVKRLTKPYQLRKYGNFPNPTPFSLNGNSYR